jgi:hypothetical protein
MENVYAIADNLVDEYPCLAHRSQLVKKENVVKYLKQICKGLYKPNLAMVEGIKATELERAIVGPLHLITVSFQSVLYLLRVSTEILLQTVRRGDKKPALHLAESNSVRELVVPGRFSAPVCSGQLVIELRKPRSNVELRQISARLA